MRTIISSHTDLKVDDLNESLPDFCWCSAEITHSYASSQITLPSEAAEITRPLKNHKAINATKAAVRFVQIQ